MSTTPAARAFVGCLALRDGATTNKAFRLAGYELKRGAHVRGTARAIIRRGRIVHVSGNAREASEWLFRLGRKIEAIGIREVRS